MGRGTLAVVEDDDVLRRNLARGLTGEGFTVAWAAPTARAALGHAATGAGEIHALVLDLSLPDGDGLDLLAALRAATLTAPVLMLTARSALEDRLQGFTAGADDYLTKPFALAELAARLDVLVRRHRPVNSQPAELTLDPAGHAVSGPEGTVALSPIEYRLLAALLARPGQVVRRATLISAGWPAGAIVRENTLDSYLGRLRRALRSVGSPRSVETARGVGYRIG